MASHSTGRGNETSALEPSTSTSETVSTTTPRLSHQLPLRCTASEAQRVRTENARPAHKSQQARNAHKFTKMTATIAGSAASEHTLGCVPNKALPTAPTPITTTLSVVCVEPPSGHCKVIDITANVAHKSTLGAQLPDCSCVIDGDFPASTSTTHATTANVLDEHVRRHTTKDVTDRVETKIATTTTTTTKHTASAAATLALTVIRTPANSGSAADATSAPRQLTTDKTSTTSISTITTPTTTVSVPTKSVLSSAAAAGEASSSCATTRRQPVHPTSARLTSTTSARLISSETIAAQVEGVALTATVDVKSKFTQNKCPLAVLTNVSNQRKVEANSTIPAATEQQRKLINSNSNSSNNCELSESNNNCNKSNIDSFSISRVPCNRWSPAAESSVHTEYDPAHRQRSAHADTTHSSRSKDTVRSTLNLAARKAKLKSDFFKDVQVHEQVSQRLTQTTSLTEICSAKKTQRISCKYSSRVQSAVVDISANQQPVNATNAAVPRIDVQPVVALSIVTQRKLALTQKFAQCSTPKTSNRSNKLQLSGAVKVEDLVQRFERQPTQVKRKKMIVQPKKTCENTDIDMLNLKPDTLEQRNSPISDEGCNLGHSPYSSDSEDAADTAKRTATNTTEHSKRKEKVMRTASSDSAVDLEVDECMDTIPAQPPAGGVNQQRRMTLTVTDLPLRPALLPLAEPTALPDTTLIELPVKALYSPTPEPVAVPSKVLLEERVVELPEDPRTLAPSLPCSRRESTQSCLSDTMPADFPVGKRFVRTPSVVVSDYSDEILCGITLEEIEYLRAQRMRRRHSSLDTANEGEGECDVSASSSCSNLYYCGSTISALDGAECYVNGVRTALERKASDCSTCSVSADEESFTIHEHPSAESKDIAELLAAQHLEAKPTTAKKVGLMVPRGEHLGEERV